MSQLSVNYHGLEYPRSSFCSIRQSWADAEWLFGLRVHVQAILQKLNVSDRTQAAIIALQKI